MHVNSEKRILLNYSPDRSLAQRTYFKIVSTLWNQKNVFNSIKDNLLSRGRYRKWSEIENLVLSSLEKLFLPDTCKLNLKNLIQPMGKQILDWISITQSPFHLYADYYTLNIDFIFDDKGILDYIRTAKFVLDHNSSQKLLCYCIACIFCIEEFISKPNASLNITSFYKRLISDPTMVSIAELGFVRIWYHKLILVQCSYLDDEPAVNPDDIGYSLAEEFMCVPIMKYFLERFPRVIKIRKIKSTLRLIFNKTRPQLGKVLLFLFSYLHESEVDALICRNTYAILSCLLQWPTQAFFITVANATWDYLSEIQYLNLFLDIAECVSEFHMSYIYKKLIEEFWKSSPTAFKKYVIHKCMFGTVLSRLFLLRNTDNIIQMIFLDCTPEIKQQIIFYFESMNICDFLLKDQRWESLKMFVLSCISSKDVLEKFIVHYQNYRSSYRTKEAEQNVLIFIEKVNYWY